MYNRFLLHHVVPLTANNSGKYHHSKTQPSRRLHFQHKRYSSLARTRISNDKTINESALTSVILCLQKNYFNYEYSIVSYINSEHQIFINSQIVKYIANLALI